MLLRAAVIRLVVGKFLNLKLYYATSLSILIAKGRSPTNSLVSLVSVVLNTPRIFLATRFCIACSRAIDLLNFY